MYEKNELQRKGGKMAVNGGLHTPFTAVFHLSVPIVVFDVQICSRQLTAIPIRLTVSSPIYTVN
jgi:hypothetical protein